MGRGRQRGASRLWPPRGAARKEKRGSCFATVPPAALAAEGDAPQPEEQQVAMHDQSTRRQHVQKALAVAGVALVTVKIGIPLLKALGGLVFGRGKKQPPPQRTAPTTDSGPSEDAWQVLDSPAPTVPSDMKEVYNTTLQCSVKEFYQRFVAGGTDFQKRLHYQLESREDYFIGPWRKPPSDGGPLPPQSACDPDDNSTLSRSGRTPYEFVLGLPAGAQSCQGCIRSMAFVQPKKPPQNVDAECVQRQQFCVFRGDVLVLAVVQNMLNIPFKDCFTVNTIWLVQPSSDGRSCTLKIHVKVNFLKGVLVGGIIKMTTMNSNVAYWKKFAEAAVAELASGAPVPVGASGSAGGAARGKGNSMFRAAGQGPGSANGTSSGADGEVVAPRRQLRFALVVLLVLVGLVNQVVLKKGIADVQNLLRG